MQDIAVSLAIGFAAGFIIGYIACLLPKLIGDGHSGDSRRGDAVQIDCAAIIQQIENPNPETEKTARRRVRKIKTKVVGVSFNNDDGSSRQVIISRHASEGGGLLLIPDPNNRYDPNAVGVWLDSPFKQIGHLSREIAEQLCEQADMKAEILQVTGRDKGALGVNIEITYKS